MKTVNRQTAANRISSHHNLWDFYKNVKLPLLARTIRPWKNQSANGDKIRSSQKHLWAIQPTLVQINNLVCLRPEA